MDKADQGEPVRPVLSKGRTSPPFLLNRANFFSLLTWLLLYSGATALNRDQEEVSHIKIA